MINHYRSHLLFYRNRNRYRNRNSIAQIPIRFDPDFDNDFDFDDISIVLPHETAEPDGFSPAELVVYGRELVLRIRRGSGRMKGIYADVNIRMLGVLR